MRLHLQNALLSLFRRLRGFSDPERQLQAISDALEDGDFQTVLKETERIITSARYRTNPLPRLRAKIRFFHSSEEYNNFISRHPSESHVSWEFPLAPEAHFHRALVFQRSGRLKSSREEIEKSLSEFPDSSKYLLERGTLLSHMKQFALAKESFRKAIENDLTCEQFYSSRAYLGLGLLYLEQADFAAARRMLAEARRLAPENREVLAHLLLIAELETDVRQRAEHFLSVGNFPLALESFQEALHRNPHDFDMHLGIAFVYKELQRFDLAQKHIRKAFQYNPGSSQVNFALGWTYLMQEQSELAEAEVLKAIRKNPYDAGYFVGLAHIYLDRVRNGEEKEGERLLAAVRQAIDLDPHYPEPHIITAEYYLITDRLKEARKAVEAAIVLAPDSQAAHILAAEIYLEMGKKRRSIHHLNEAADFGHDTEEMRSLRERLKGDLL